MQPQEVQSIQLEPLKSMVKEAFKNEGVRAFMYALEGVGDDELCRLERDIELFDRTGLHTGRILHVVDSVLGMIDCDENLHLDSRAYAA